MFEDDNLDNIRRLLAEGFSQDELRCLCFDVKNFRAVYDHLTQETSKAEIIARLIKHAQQQGQLEFLLALAKEYQPASSEKYPASSTFPSAGRPYRNFPPPAPAANLRPRILVVEDEPVWQEILQECLVETGYLVEIATNFNEARQKLQSGRFNLVTLDAHLHQHLETHEGMLLLDYIRNQLGSPLPVVVISGAINKRDLIRAFKKFSVADVLLKENFAYDEFREMVREALQVS